MITRRELIGGLPALFVIGCKSADALPATCNDATGLTPEEAGARATMGYVDASPHDGKSCAACTQYLAANASGACGTCKLLKGPIHPRGWCKAFAARG